MEIQQNRFKETLCRNSTALLRAIQGGTDALMEECYDMNEGHPKKGTKKEV